MGLVPNAKVFQPCVFYRNASALFADKRNRFACVLQYERIVVEQVVAEGKGVIFV